MLGGIGGLGLMRFTRLLLPPLPQKIAVEKQVIKHSSARQFFGGEGRGEGKSRGSPGRDERDARHYFFRVMFVLHGRPLPAALPLTLPSPPNRSRQMKTLMDRFSRERIGGEGTVKCFAFV